ncbi:phage tail tape measure protein [Mesorhizobium sp. B4-1-1]|uniref:phage tail tape measure protein n=1 Tax=Mesorhizobium sp. B4-1-1 TaxID=2589890 RepID=UPI00112EA897|nr:phage tail tape measure protein [Mesorhizobium sp. B4-1-1]TPI13874.1 phage tail tape measure protein [Mesorhizobium sp. B4-1-1]
MEAELKKLGTTGEKAIGEIQGAANKVSLANLGGAINGFGNDLLTVGKRLTLAFAGISAAVTSAAPFVLFLAKSGAEAAEQASNAAQAAGIQVEAYQALAFAAGQANVSQEQLGVGLSQFNKQITKTASDAGKSVGQMGRDIKQGVGFTIEAFKDIGVEVTRFGDQTKAAGDKAKKGAKDTTTGFQDLGISVKDAGGKLKPTEQLLLEVANAFQKLPDGAKKSTVAIKLFGESGARLIPFLNQGADAIKEITAEAAKMGIIFSDDQIQAAQDFNTAMGDLQKSVSSLLRQVGLLFAPAFTAGARSFRDIINQNRAAILSFTRDALAQATTLIKDFFAALSGRDADVTSNKWLIDWRDGIVGFGSDFKAVATGVVIPAMELLRKTAQLVSDAVNGIFGTDLSAGKIAILAGITQILGGFTLLRSAIVLAVEALAFFSRALLANPWLLAITAVAGGIALWATRTDEATASLRVHEDLIGKVGDAYDQAGRKVANMTQFMKDQALVALNNNRPAIADSLANEVENAKAALQLFDQQLPFAGDAIDALNKEVETGKIGWAEYAKQIAALGAAHPELGALAQELLDTTKPVVDLSNKLAEADDWTKTLTGSMTDAQFAAAQAARGIAGYGTSAQQAGSDAAAGLNSANAAVDQTKAKVGELDHQITVFRGGKDGISKEVFDVIDGVAHRADQSKQSLDGVVDSAKKAKEQIQGVSNEVTNSIAAVPDAIKPDAAAAAVDGIVGDVGKIAPAAQEAATGASDALSNIDTSGAAAAAEAFALPFQGLPGQIGAILSAIQGLVRGGFGNLASTVSSLAAQIRGEIASIISALQAAVAQAQQLRAQAGSSDGGGSHGGFAEGGHVVGPGGPKTDSILAWLSNGEFVLQAAAVKRLGVGFLHALNNGFIPSLKSLKGFSLGGVVDNFSRAMAIPAYAGGGLATSNLAPASGFSGDTVAVKLQYGPTVADVIDLIGEADPVNRFQQFALRGSIASLGRRPGGK